MSIRALRPVFFLAFLSACPARPDCPYAFKCPRPADAGGGAAGGGGVAGTSSGGTGVGGLSGTAGKGGAGGATEPCNGRCSGSTPVCNDATNTCVECVGSSDCAAPNPVCDPATNTCVQCLASTDCSAPKPACDTANHSCVECTGDGDCSAGTPLCDTSAHGCVQCLASSDCTDAATARCDAGTCKPCKADADCSHITGQTVCDTTSGACVQCTGTDYAACGTDSATSTPLVCDSLKHTCTTNKERSSGLCGGCVSDAHCPLGQMCVLETFGTPAQNVGYFCFWKQGDTANGAPADCTAGGRPYVAIRTNAISIDGTTADICSLRVSTCIANNEFSSRTCTSTSDNTTCGFDPPNDAKCAVFGPTTFLCTMTCVSDIDCPAFTCNTLVNPHVCNLQ